MSRPTTAVVRHSQHAIVLRHRLCTVLLPTHRRTSVQALLQGFRLSADDVHAAASTGFLQRFCLLVEAA